MARHAVAASTGRGRASAAAGGGGASAPIRRAGSALPPPQAGFTLVEILVVLAIIATLVGLVAAFIPVAMKQRDVTKTQSTISAVGIGLETLEVDREQFGKYPPSRLKDLRIRKNPVGRDLGQANDINTGIECVYFLLNNPEVKLDRDLPVADEFKGNTDEDSYRTAKGNASDALAREYLDAWQNPLVYIHNADYKDTKGCDQVKRADGTLVTVRPKKSTAAAGGGFKRPNSFQLFSLGPDGEQDPDEAEEGDDILYGE
ncbi:MAG: type II secretion system protein [Planctomycetaceae bacterium]|nr:type II secretion system protein [Planctomycetaceae bacterium]